MLSRPPTNGAVMLRTMFIFTTGSMKQYTGDWRHRALRHHSAGVQWAIEKFGHVIVNSDGKEVPTKMVVERHIEEDCGFVPTPHDYLLPLKEHPSDWMLKVKTKSVQLMKIE